MLIAKATDGTLTDVKAAFDSGFVIPATGTETAALILDYEADTSAPTDATLTFRRTSSGDLETTINGVTTVFTSADLEEDGDGYSIEPEGGGLIGVFGQGESLQDQMKDSGSHSGTISYFSSNVDGKTVYTYAILGARTAADVAPSGGAQFNGDFKIETLPVTGFESLTTDRTRLEGEVTLDVDVAGMISGRLTDLTIRSSNDGDRETVPGEIAMSQSAIAADSFSGNLTANQTLVDAKDFGLTDADFGSYTGRLYGPDAEEATGILTVTVPLDEGVEMVLDISALQPTNAMFGLAQISDNLTQHYKPVCTCRRASLG
ncbi:MAG: hypothetical protein ACI85V_000288 [bacterium]